MKLRAHASLPVAALAAFALPLQAQTIVGRAPFPDVRQPPPHEALNDAQREQYAFGQEIFNTVWAPAGAANAARTDGVGPLFVTASCEQCHGNAGRGRRETRPGEPSNSFVMQLGGVSTAYGNVINTQALEGHAPEARIVIGWRERTGRHKDGAAWTLREPQYTLADLAHGALPPETVLQPRIAPAVFGNGLLESVPKAALEAVRQSQPKDQRGQPAGRFGWQGEVVSVADQSARAFAREMGLTSQWETRDDCTAAQSACQGAPHGGAHEVSAELFAAVVSFQTRVAVPARPALDAMRDSQGAALFARAGCADCHRPQLPVIHNIPDAVIDAYTDLLRHDMGEGLADRRMDGKPVPRLWRTAPLWGIAHVLAQGEAAFLHDGRARTLEEAILWHGGEAEDSRRAFSALPRAQRQQLLDWLATL